MPGLFHVVATPTAAHGDATAAGNRGGDTTRPACLHEPAMSAPPAAHTP